MLFTGQKKNFGFHSNCRYCADHAPTFGSQCFKFHPKQFTFGGIIAERVKAVLFVHRVFP